jgi:GNAT superfamily N-acetyltransferase
VEPVLRRFDPATDSVEELTSLLHACYASLLAQGFRFTATAHSVETTRHRLAGARCWVAEAEGRFVGTVSWSPDDPSDEVPFYRQPEVAHFNQFGVLPELRGHRLGRRLLEAAEREAAAEGYKVLALDTAQPADGLVRLYEAWGFRQVALHDWRREGEPGVNYLSVVMARPIEGSDQTGHTEA